ncbi:MAG: hypothetical protein GVY33_14760 [Alphaproteobacteria bacterium]|jgi:Ca2+-binding RTX toxin-like protein|nr:hypothetical protein [Alphaproteobacteria bacterium]
MVAGPQLRRFESNLGTTASYLDEIQDELRDVRAKVREARKALETPERIEDDADEVGDKLENLQLVLKVTDKVTVLKPLSFALTKTLNQAERVADRIEDKAKTLRRKIEDTGWIEDLERTENKIAEFEADLAGNAANVRNYQDTTGKFADGFDAVGRPAAPLADATDDAVRPPNVAFDEIDATYNSIKDEAFALTDLIDQADFRPVIEVGNDFADVKEAVCQLSDPLSIAYSALKPLEPLLDAAGFVFSITVDPVLDWLFDKIGLDDAMDVLGDRIERLLPDDAPLDTLQEKIDAVFDDVTDFLDDGFGIEGWLGDIDAELLDPVTDATAGPTGYGTAAAETVGGDGGDDILDGRGGDDRVVGGAGDDLLVASAGDDVLIGGPDRDGDTVVFNDNFSNYVITQPEDDGPLIVEHATPGRRRPDDGRETLFGVEELRFVDLATTRDTLRDGVQRADGPVLTGTADDDFLYGGTTAVQIRGRAGDDWITGSTAADVLVGARGDDTFSTKDGADEVYGGKGRDTWLFPADDRAGGLVEADLAEGTTWDGRDRDQLVNVENVLVQADLDSTVRGDDGPNVLRTAGGDDLVDGRGGDDRIDGGAGRDTLIGGRGVDVVVAGPGSDDLVVGGPAVRGRTERYDGGEGAGDALVYSTDFDRYARWVDDTEIGPQAASDGVRIFAERGRVARLDPDGREVVARDVARGIERFVGSDVDDLLRGAAPRQIGDERILFSIDGAGGSDVLYSDGAARVGGGPGDDRLIATIGDADGSTLLDGGPGRDRLDLTADDVRWSLRLEGAIGTRLEGFRTIDAQELGATSGTADPTRPTRVFNGNVESIEVVQLGAADDELVMGGFERMTVFGGRGDDLLRRDVANDGSGRGVLYGQSGDDRLLLAEAGALYGNTGDDELTVRTAFDGVVARGGGGDDFVLVQRGDGVFRGDRGYDTLSLDPISGQSTLSLDLHTGALVAPGTSGRIEGTVSGFEQVIGGTDGIADDIAGRWGAGERLFGRGGDDDLAGRGGPDELYGGRGDDGLAGGRGDDLLHGAAGDDVLRGGRGSDTASYANAVPGGARAETTADDTAFGSVEVDLARGTASGAAGTDRLFGIENLYGGEAGDRLLGDAAANALYGAGGDDVLAGRGGDDVLVPGRGDDVVFGGRGNDRIVFDVGDLEVYGGRGWDRLDLGTVAGNVTIDFTDVTFRARLRVDTPVWRDTGTTEPRDYDGSSYTPRDVLETDPAFADGADDLTRELPPAPTPEDEEERPEVGETYERFKIEAAVVPTDFEGRFANIQKIVGGAAATRLLPSADVDRFDGREDGSDRDRLDLIRADGPVRYRLDTGETNHALLENDRFKGLDEVRGSRFGDGLYGGDGDDALYGRSGNDRVQGGGGADLVAGNAGRDTLVGGTGDDVLVGGFGDDRLAGRAGDDRLYGGLGADRLVGGRGDDTLRGGPGDDTMIANAGADRFVVRPGDDRTTIKDLSLSDRLLLDGELWRGELTASQVVNRFGEPRGPDYVLSFGGGDETVVVEDSDRRTVVDVIEIL